MSVCEAQWAKHVKQGSLCSPDHWFDTDSKHVHVFKDLVENAYLQTGQVTHELTDNKRIRVGVLVLSMSRDNEPNYFVLDNVKKSTKSGELLSKCIAASGLLDENNNVSASDIFKTDAFRLNAARYNAKLDKVTMIDDIFLRDFSLYDLAYTVDGNSMCYYCILTYNPNLSTGVKESAWCCVM